MVNNTYIVVIEVKDNNRKVVLKDKVRQEYRNLCSICDNCWGIKTSDTHVEIRENLSKYIGEDDILFVIRSGIAAAWRNIYTEDSIWLKENL